MSRISILTLALLLVVCTCHKPLLAEEDSPQEQMLRATCRVHQGSSSGTGFLVEFPRKEGTAASVFLVTAHHVFENFADAECKLILRERKADGLFERQAQAVRIRDGKQALWVRHPQEDVAAIEVKLPLSTDMRPLPFAQVADAEWAAQRKIRVGQEVWIPCFPAQLEANSVGWPILRRGTIATHPLTPLPAAKTILIDYSHFGGDSGSPAMMVHEGDPILVGLVFGMQRQTDRATMPFEERTVHTPLGLALTVQSPLVRETIEQAAK